MPELRLGWDTAWWFPVVYGLITLAVVALYGRAFSQRFFSFPRSESIRQKIPVALSAAVFGRALMVFSIFVPLQPNTLWFWLGLFVFGVGAVLTAGGMVTFARTPLDQPVTTGLYRFSRHPIQVLAVIMWLGVGLATASWIIMGACVLLGLVYYPSFLAQERSCLEQYGDAYHTYMASTPRYLLFGG